MGVFPPQILDVVTLLNLIVSIMALGVAVYVWMVRRQDRQIIAEIERKSLVQVKVLERRLKALEHERERLLTKLEESAAEPEIELPEVLARLLGQESGEADSDSGVPAPSAQREIADGITEEALAQKRAKREAEKKKRGLASGNDAIWQRFIDDYNHLADSLDAPLAEKACEDFCDQQQLQLLICTDHAAEINGQRMPRFERAATFAACTYWAWPITGQPGDYAVVPNPLVPVDKEANDKGGIKETFATNYEEADQPYKHIQVRLPALFRLDHNRWLIDQPGVIRLS